VKAFCEILVARKEPAMVAVVAVVRRLLQALWRMLRTNEAFAGARFAPKPAKAA